MQINKNNNKWVSRDWKRNKLKVKYRKLKWVRQGETKGPKHRDHQMSSILLAWSITRPMRFLSQMSSKAADSCNRSISPSSSCTRRAKAGCREAPCITTRSYLQRSVLRVLARRRMQISAQIDLRVIRTVQRPAWRCSISTRTSSRRPRNTSSARATTSRGPNINLWWRRSPGAPRLRARPPWPPRKRTRM